MSGIDLIAAERQRQIQAEGWSESHDDEHDLGELASAAACYALPDIQPDWWPWHDRSWKPTHDDSWEGEGRIRELVKAGALIAAELDRLERAAVPAADEERT